MPAHSQDIEHEFTIHPFSTLTTTHPPETKVIEHHRNNAPANAADRVPHWHAVVGCVLCIHVPHARIRAIARPDLFRAQFWLLWCHVFLCSLRIRSHVVIIKPSITIDFLWATIRPDLSLTFRCAPPRDSRLLLAKPCGRTVVGQAA
jgi:hypothetical protein